MAQDNKVLMSLAIVAVIVAVISVVTVFFSVDSLVSKISGYAVTYGEANLTVESAVVINFTTSFINWGSGRVNEGQTNATLNTLELNNVTNGNWTLATPGGLRIENIGNVNVSLNFTAGKTAASYIGGTNPTYKWNVSALEANSCLNSTGTGTTNFAGFNQFVDTSTSSTNICGTFQFVDSADFLRVDIELVVPSDSQTGALTDTITSTVIAL